MEIVQGFKDLGGGLWLEWSVSWGHSRGEAARKPLPNLAKVSSGTGAVGATRKVETAHLSGSQPSVDLLLPLSLSVAHVVLQVSLFSPSFYPFCRTPLDNSIPSFASFCTQTLTVTLLHSFFLNQPSARLPIPSNTHTKHQQSDYHSHLQAFPTYRIPYA